MPSQSLHLQTLGLYVFLYDCVVCRPKWALQVAVDLIESDKLITRTMDFQRHYQVTKGRNKIYVSKKENPLYSKKKVVVNQNFIH